MKPEKSIQIEGWQKQLLDERLADYYLNPTDVVDFDKTIDEIEEALLRKQQFN